MHAWNGWILRVDLTSGVIEKKSFASDFALKWLGGEGFGARILWDEVGPEVEDGLDPRNLLIYATGPLTGTIAPSSGRLEIVTKSPLTGIFGDSNAGGHFAPELKAAGYDALVITGKAARPVYLLVNDGEVQIRDASHLWGRTVPDTDRLLKEETGDTDIQISCIGPGGENLVRFAIAMNNIDRAPGWTGCGAVAGSKKLKAIAVRGTGGVSVARPSEFEQACRQAREKLKSFRLLPPLRKFGTNYLYSAFYVNGFCHLNNYNVAQCSEDHYRQICPEEWARYLQSLRGCHGCPLHCQHFAAVKEGAYRGVAGGAYEFGSFQPYLNSYGSSSIPFAMAATQFCNDYGIDGSEPGMLLAWATDCFKKGIITRKDTDGLVLDWGDQATALKLLRRIVYREGFGNILAEGLWRAARKLGPDAQELAQTIKGRPSVEGVVRASYGCALASATSTRGGDHLKGFPHLEFLNPAPETSMKFFGHPQAGNRSSPEGKAGMTVYGKNIYTLIDMLGLCKYHSSPPLVPINEADYAAMLSAATGFDLSPGDLLVAAERVYNLEQAYNIRLGLSRKDDSLPSVFFNTPLSNGPLKGFVLQRPAFEKMLDEYYAHRGWDVNTGVPARATLEALGMPDVADALEKFKPKPTGA
ncbi:MAG: aldehyde ferredoxin oxidoreductase family protein [Chloroflexi bacterium]|nr:aldehyde ferredoxin oxidoreductase family protein [Chloroflexota bacterium]